MTCCEDASANLQQQDDQKNSAAQSFDQAFFLSLRVLR
jgi:hypothetical protein